MTAPVMTPAEPLLRIRGLSVDFGPLAAVRDLDLDLHPGELLGLVGESGSGKSVAMLAVMGLVDPPGRVRAAELRFAGQDLLAMSPRQRRALLGRDIAMIFQDPVASLNPAYTVGFQLIETLKVHQAAPRGELRERALALLQQVEIPDAPARLAAYPHQLSGGMSQRVMIAMALACRPRLLIADEPTTALDVTIQAQVLRLLVDLQRHHGMALVLISHDLALVAEHADRAAVMYAGEVVEVQPLPSLFDRPRHPYTAALRAALPDAAAPAGGRLAGLPGVVPGAGTRLPGCLLAPRCPKVRADCRAVHPPLAPWSAPHPLPVGAAASAQVRCLHPLDGPLEGQR